MFCKYCGYEMNDNDKFCAHCGKFVDNNNNQIQTNDTGSFGWAVLGFFIPIIGLILFLVWNTERPKTAKKAGIGALVGVIAEFVFTFIYIIIIFALAYEFNWIIKA